jgi:O-antigen/teichoic acid export membrane protein
MVQRRRSELGTMLRSSSVRHAAELAPSVVVPGIASFVGLVLLGHVSGLTIVGYVSLAWITSNTGAVILGLGPSMTAARAVVIGDTELVASLRFSLARRVITAAVVLALVGVVVSFDSTLAGSAVLFGGLWIVPQAVAVFETEVLKSQRRFRRATGFAVMRGCIGWAAAVAVASQFGGVAAAVAPNVVVGVVLAIAMKPIPITRPTSRSTASLIKIGRPIAITLLASYVLGYGDRYVVQGILGPAALGAYTIAYQLGEGVVEIFSVSISGALQPRIIAEWQEPTGGPMQAIRTAKRGAVAILLAAGCVAVALVIAGELGILTKLTDVPDVTPIATLVAIGMGFNGIVRVSTALFLAEGRPSRAVPVVWTTVGIAVVLVPLLTWLHGLAGAAVANLIVYVLLAVLYGRLAFRLPSK